MLGLFGAGFVTILTNPINLLLIFGCVVVGIIFGALPGLSTLAAISICLPLTYGMDLGISIAMLTAIYVGGTSGGLVSSIMLNMPGTAAAIATCFDGRPMALKGEAGRALGIGIFCSFMGSLIGIAVLVFLSPVMAAFTIKFGPWEMFSVTLLSLSLISSLVGKSLTKGLISAIVGVMISTIGMAPIDSARRYIFGITELTAGFTIVPVLVGFYAMSEILLISSRGEGSESTKMITDFKLRGFGFSIAEMAGQAGNIIRSAFVGIGIGILPGIGAATSNIVSYSIAKSSSRYPEKFGTGIIDGLVAPETANNATIGGSLIPLLTLGIPGDGTTALVLAAFMLQGVTPGPLLFDNQAPAIYMIFSAMILASFIMLAVMFFGIKGFIQILKVPMYVLMPVIVVLCIIGAYAVNFTTFDAWALFVFGIIGIVMKKFDIPIPPLILGFILGRPFEANLRRGIQFSNGNVFGFIHHPIALFFFASIVLFFAFSVLRNLRRKSTKNV